MSSAWTGEWVSGGEWLAAPCNEAWFRGRVVTGSVKVSRWAPREGGIGVLWGSFGTQHLGFH